MQPQLPPDFIRDYQDVKKRLEIAEKSLTNDSVPIGAEILWPASTALLPWNYVLSDGRALDRIAYATLFAELGTTFGVGDGVTSFNIPNRTGARVNIPTAPVWTGISYAASYSDYPVAGYVPGSYYKDAFGFVHLRGLVHYATPGSYPTSGPLGTLPVGFRPSALELFIVSGSSTGNGVFRMDLNPNGDIGTWVPVAGTGNWDGSFVSLAGITFDSGTVPTATTAETDNWVIKVY